MPYRCFETFPIHCQICGFLQLNQGHWHPLDITSVRLRSFHGGCYIWEFGDHLLLKDESQRTVADDRTNAAIGENVDHLIQTWQDRNRELSLYENITRTRTPLYDDDSVYCKNCRCSEEQHNAWTQENAGVVQLDYWNSGRCMWYIGSKAVLKDQKLDMDVGHEEAAIKYVRKHTTIPVPRWVRCWQESGRALLFMERLPGQPLQEAQLRRVLDEDTVAIIKDEIVGYLGQLRKLQAPKPGSPDGHQIRSLPFRRQDTKIRWLLPPTHEEAKEDWYQKSLSGVGPSHLSKLNELKLNFPASEPYTFTHGYLNGSNVMVYEGRVSGIIDWELSGFAPVCGVALRNRIRTNKRYSFGGREFLLNTAIVYISVCAKHHCVGCMSGNKSSRHHISVRCRYREDILMHG